MCFFGSPEVALMGNFTPIFRTAWVHSGALRTPLRFQGDVMAHFAGRHEVGVKFPMRAASVDPNSSTPPKLAKRPPKVGGFAAHFACGFLEGWNALAHSALEVFARRP